MGKVKGPITNAQYMQVPYKCPWCKSQNIEAGPFDGEAQEQLVTCLSCGKKWHDTYELTGYIPYDYKEKPKLLHF